MRYVNAVIVSIFCLMVLQVPPTALGEGADRSGPEGPANSRVRLSHAPISIISDTDFASQATLEGWPGTGAPDDPYVISSLEINGSCFNHGISIRDSSVHFVIEDCLIMDTDDLLPYPTGSGIVLLNVQNGSVEGCIIERSLSNGILAHDCGDVSFKNTSITGSIGGTGINLDSCSDVVIEGCLLEDNGNGIRLEHVTGSVRNCTMRSNRYNGMEIYYSSGLKVDDNLLEDNGEIGIYIRSNSYGNEFHGNTFFNCSFGMFGAKEVFTTNHIPVNNLVNGLPVHQMTDHAGSGEEISMEGGQFILGNVSDVVLARLEIAWASEALILGHCSRIIVRDCNLSGNQRGMEIVGGDNITVEDCTFLDCDRLGIYMEETKDGIVRDSRFRRIEFGIWAGDDLCRFRVEDNSIEQCEFGIVIGGAIAPVIRNNMIIGSDELGIGLEMVFDAMVEDNWIDGQGYRTSLGRGVSAIYTEDMTSRGNRVFGAKIGIETYGSKRANISNNTIDTPVEKGMLIVDSTNLTVTENLFYRSASLAIDIVTDHGPTRDNTFWNNSFLYNNGASTVFLPGRFQAHDATGLDHWSSDAEQRGNHWSDWTSPDMDGDGVVDVPYELDGGAMDMRPLVRQPLLLLTPPTDVAAEGGRLTNNVTWGPPTFTRSGQMSGYRVYRTVDGSEPSLLQEMPSDATYLIDMDVDNGVVYHYSVTGFNRYGEGEPSPWVRGVPDSSPPVIVITAPQNGSYWNVTDIGASWGMSDNVGVVDSMYRIDEGNWTGTGSASEVLLTNLSEGDHRLEISAIDLVGNSAVAATVFHVDLTAPEIDIIAPSGGSALPTSTVTVEWVAEDLPYMELGLRFRVDDGNWTETDGTSASISGLSEGGHLFVLEARDLANNTALRSVAFTVDTISPLVTIIQPTEGAEFPGRPLNATWSADGTGAAITGYRIKLDSGDWEDVGLSTSEVLMGLDRGNHTFWVSAEDGAGNTGTDHVSFMVTSDIPEPPPPGKALITGVVKDGDGNALHKVKVRSDTGEETYTDSEGVFYLEVEPGRRTLTFSKRGYETYDRIVEANENQTVDLEEIDMQRSPTGGDDGLRWWQYCLCCLVPFIVLILMFITIGAVARIRRNNRRKLDEE